MSKSVLRPRQPNEVMLAGRPDNRRCAHCKLLFHKDRLIRHLATKHGIVAESVPSEEWTVNPLSKPASKPQLSISKRLKTANSGKKPKRTKSKTTAKKQYDGQPRFEGGIMWSQAGSPGLGKRR